MEITLQQVVFWGFMGVAVTLLLLSTTNLTPHKIARNAKKGVFPKEGDVITLRWYNRVITMHDGEIWYRCSKWIDIHVRLNDWSPETRKYIGEAKVISVTKADGRTAINCKPIK